MAESPQELQKPTDSEHAAILWIVWEMTKQSTQATKASKLQKEFAENLDAVLEIWENRGRTSEEELTTMNGIPQDSAPEGASEPKKKKRRLFTKK